MSSENVHDRVAPRGSHEVFVEEFIEMSREVLSEMFIERLNGVCSRWFSPLFTPPLSQVYR